MESIATSSDTLVGLLVALVITVLVLGVGGAFVVVVVANRADPDPSGRRPFVVYLFGVAFITLWTGLFGTLAVVYSLVQLIGSHPQGSSSVFGGSLHPIGDAAARGAVLGGLVLVVSAVTFRYHLRRGLLLSAGDPDQGSPAKRVARSYVAAVAFVSVLVLVVSLIYAAYFVFELAGPGVFGGASRISTLRYLVDTAYLAAAVGGILWWHLNTAKPQLWPWQGGHPAAPPPPPTPPVVPYGPSGPSAYGPAPQAPAPPAQYAPVQPRPVAPPPTTGYPASQPHTDAVPPLPPFGQAAPAPSPHPPPLPPPPPGMTVVPTAMTTPPPPPPPRRS